MTLILWSLFCLLVGAIVTSLVWMFGVVRHDEARHQAELDEAESRRLTTVSRLAALNYQARKCENCRPTLRP